jgi:hypothetical protein
MVLRKEWLLNPFRRVAGMEALWLGFGFMLLGALIAWPAHMHFDGALDVHGSNSASPLWIHVAEPFIAWACTALVFFIVARIGAGSRFRAIDLAGTLALSRAPLLLIVPIGFFIKEPVDPSHPDPIILLTAIPILIAAIWMITLMYQAFKVSVNPKPARTALLFILAMLLAEGLSKLLFSFIYKHLFL